MLKKNLDDKNDKNQPDNTNTSPATNEQRIFKYSFLHDFSPPPIGTHAPYAKNGISSHGDPEMLFVWSVNILRKLAGSLKEESAKSVGDVALEKAAKEAENYYIRIVDALKNIMPIQEDFGDWEKRARSIHGIHNALREIKEESDEKTVKALNKIGATKKEFDDYCKWQEEARNKGIDVDIEEIHVEPIVYYPNSAQYNKGKADFAATLKQINLEAEKSPHKALWKPILANIVLCAIGLGILAIGFKLVHSLVSKGPKNMTDRDVFLFGHTKGKEAVSAISECFEKAKIASDELASEIEKKTKHPTENSNKPTKK
jgi:hypothetical protein